MNYWPNISIKSPWGRLVLIPPGPEDDIDVAALRSNPEALKYLSFMPKTMSPEEWRKKREKNSSNEAVWKFHVHRVITPSSKDSESTLIGQCGILNLDMQNCAGDIGIIIHPRYHREGIASEALYMTLRHAFEHPELKLHRVQFVTGSNNVEMRGWLTSFGIQMEYRLREAWSDGEGGRLDSMGYSILVHEWPVIKARLEERLTTRLGSPVS